MFLCALVLVSPWCCHGGCAIAHFGARMRSTGSAATVSQVAVRSVRCKARLLSAQSAGAAACCCHGCSSDFFRFLEFGCCSKKWPA